MCKSIEVFENRYYVCPLSLLFKTDNCFPLVSLCNNKAARPYHAHYHYHGQKYFSAYSLDLCQLSANGGVLSPDNFASCLTLGRVVKKVGFVITFFPLSRIMRLIFDASTKSL